MRCKHCGVPIIRVVEPHWTGWIDEDGDPLCYVPTLHDHEPVQP